MEQKQVHPEEEYSFLDFSSSSTLLLRCSIDSEGEHTSFEWTDYGIEAFSKLQQLDEIDIDDYMDSVRGHETLRFLLSHKTNVTSVRLSIDDRFIVKIISKSQMKFFLEMLPKYYGHMKKNKNTLLTPFMVFMLSNHKVDKRRIRHHTVLTLVGNAICPAPFETVIQVRDSLAHPSGGQESEISDSEQDLSSDYDSVSSCPKQIEGKFGVRMAAQAVSKRRKESDLASTTHTSGKDQHNNLIMFFGIVDIIPHYSMLRHVEHVFRSLRGDGSGSYSARFHKYLLRVFPEND